LESPPTTPIISYRKMEEDPEGNKWARSLKGTKTIKVSYIDAWLITLLGADIHF